MKLAHIVSEYIALKQSLGMGFTTEATVLKAFCRTACDGDIQEVSREVVLSFLQGKGPVTSFWQKKFQTLSGFYKFAIGRGYVNRSPLPTSTPRLPQPIPPYIYTVDELHKLFAAARAFETTRGTISSPTFCTLLQTLYGAGLRLSEAINLTFKDVDLKDRMLIIRNSKFFKTRLVPVSSKLTSILSRHEMRRTRLSCSDNSPFLASRCGQPLTRYSAERYFRKVCDRVNIRRAGGPRFQPRLHDLRHTFAVHRLCEWYRQGADVQRLILHLSTYLGHIGIASTQRYLSMTNDLLQEANQCFESYFVQGVINV